MASDDEDLRPSPTLFGRRLADIPCYRSTFLYSTCAALGSTMAYFLFTSKMKKALGIGMVVFPTVTITYWCYCRYNYSVQKFEYARLQEAVTRYHLKDMDGRDR